MIALRPPDLACRAEVSGHSNLIILTAKDMLQRLPIALALANLKTSNMKSDKSNLFYI